MIVLSLVKQVRQDDITVDPDLDFMLAQTLFQSMYTDLQYIAVWLCASVAVELFCCGSNSVLHLVCCWVVFACSQVCLLVYDTTFFTCQSLSTSDQ